jgi:membrane-associated protease RseP (regulator of RpoE activity)
MSPDPRLIFTVVFFALLTWFVWSKKENMQTHKILHPILYFSMYRTTWGLASMDTYAKKYARILNWLGTAGIVVGFLGMIFICIELIKNLFKLFSSPEAAPGVGLVLPFKAKGIFYVPIEYWIICIFVIALIHEFAHGVLSRVYDVKVKSSGFAFLSILIPIVPAAFVEPDEKKLRKKPLRQQLAVFAAGPFSNVILAFICLGILWGLAPMADSLIEPIGVEITELVEGDYPAKMAGIVPGEVVEKVNGIPVPYVQNLSTQMAKYDPGDTIELQTDKQNHIITLAKNPDNESMAYMGAYLNQKTDIKPGVKENYGVFLPNVLFWISGLFVFLFILNLGIGLFNLVPIGPLDGGRMLHAVLMKYVEKEKGMQLFSMVGMTFVLIILINILFPFVKNLF